jgi:hypothetical protein
MFSFLFNKTDEEKQKYISDLKSKYSNSEQKVSKNRIISEYNINNCSYKLTYNVDSLIVIHKELYSKKKELNKELSKLVIPISLKGTKLDGIYNNIENINKQIISTEKKNKFINRYEKLY